MKLNKNIIENNFINKISKEKICRYVQNSKMISLIKKKIKVLQINIRFLIIKW